MLKAFKTCCFVLSTLAFSSNTYGDLVFTPFGTGGQGGSVNGQVFTFGSSGAVFELDGFISVDGLDLNGPTFGGSAQLSIDALPPGMDYKFNSNPSIDLHSVTLSYTFTNTSNSIFTNVQFFSFIDAEIDVPRNGFTNESGSVLGTLGLGTGGPDPSSFEIDEPGYAFGDIFRNLRLGVLDNTNSLPRDFPDDVSMALGFSIGDLAPNSIAMIQIQLSDNGNSLGRFALQHFDTDPSSSDTLTLSGEVYVRAVPEPSSVVAFGTGALAVFISRRYRRGLMA